SYTITMIADELVISGTIETVSVGGSSGGGGGSGSSGGYSGGGYPSFGGSYFSGWGGNSSGSSGMGGFGGSSGSSGGGGIIDWNAINEWASLRTSSPRNMLRFTFNTIETIGTTMEVVGLVGAPFSEGATLAYTQLGFYINSIGVYGNAIIDLYDGQY